jgi:uncharacterized protein (DUF885 family)
MKPIEMPHQLKRITRFAITCLFMITGNAYSQNKDLRKILDDYYQERLELFPIQATYAGIPKYNDFLQNDGSQEYLDKLQKFYLKYLKEIAGYNQSNLSFSDWISCRILRESLEMESEALKYHPEYMPVNQFNTLPPIGYSPLPAQMGLFGSGTGAQPFKSVKDYENWLKRISLFTVWVDTAISNFNKGIAAHIVLPKALVIKIIPQLESLAHEDTSRNIFFGPVRKFPLDFSEEQKKRLSDAYYHAITTELIPAYKKLTLYIKNDYMPHARLSSGYNDLPNGKEMYAFYVRFFTTTHKSPEEIYQIGLKQVDSIHTEMEKIKTETGFKGTLMEFFKYLETDPRFTPFNSPEEVLDAYRAIYKKIEPNLPLLFGVKPTTAFEIRQTETFRAASAAAQYFGGSLDGKRPGIFYVPIIDAQKYYSFSMEDLFMHEAIPGHHYQISLQKEDTTHSLFRRTYGISSFNEGWGLYAETLGKQLGCYTDPYQYFGSLQNQIHRAIRLVVDVSLHTGRMNREEAIKYMLDNEPESEQVATAEIERYMAWPGQALSYKMGELAIESMRDKGKAELGTKFNLRDFHDEILEGGSMPLDIFEDYMNHWIQTKK